MTILVGDPVNGIYPWRTQDGKFAGYLIPPLTMTSTDPSETTQLPAGALLAVPKYSPREEPSINKYSPTIAQAPTIEELRPKLEAWVRTNHDKTLWSLRDR